MKERIAICLGYRLLWEKWEEIYQKYLQMFWGALLLEKFLVNIKITAQN